MKVGNPKSQDTDIGSVISQSHMEKVSSYINLAEQEGGTILPVVHLCHSMNRTQTVFLSLQH